MIKPKSKQMKNADQKILEPNAFFETEKQHKNWYDPSQMGKQRGRPVGRPAEIRKAKGTHKHSLKKGI